MEKVSFFCLVAIAVPVNAQNTATAWTGVVRTAAGEPIAGAKVTVSSTQEKQQTAVTGITGQFAIADLASGGGWARALSAWFDRV